MAARVKYGSVITELKGSVGGQTFQSCRGGFILRNKPISPKVRSSLQQSLRSATGQVAQAWRDLTPAQRATWDAVAPSWPKTDKFGDPATYTGYELFMHCNVALVTLGQSILTTGSLPDTMYVPAGLTLTADSAGPTLELSWSSGAFPADMAGVVYSSPWMSAGRSFRRSDLRTIQAIAPLSASPANLQSEFVKNYGQFPPVGSQLFAGLIIVSLNTGQQSQLYNASTIVI